MCVLDSATYLKEQIFANAGFLYGKEYEYKVISSDVSEDTGHAAGTKTNLYLIAYHHKRNSNNVEFIDHHPDFRHKRIGDYRGQKFHVIAWACVGNNRIGALGRLLQFTEEKIAEANAFVRGRNGCVRGDSV